MSECILESCVWTYNGSHRSSTKLVQGIYISLVQLNYRHHWSFVLSFPGSFRAGKGPQFFELIVGNAITNLMVRLEAGACKKNLQQYLPRGLRNFCVQHLRAYSPTWKCMADQKFLFKEIVNEAHRVKNVNSIPSQIVRSFLTHGRLLVTCYKGNCPPFSTLSVLKSSATTPTSTVTAHKDSDSVIGRGEEPESCQGAVYDLTALLTSSWQAWRGEELVAEYVAFCFLFYSFWLRVTRGEAHWYLRWSHDYEYAAELVCAESISTVPLVVIYSHRVS